MNYMDFPPPPPLIRTIQSAYWHGARSQLSSNPLLIELVAHVVQDWTYIMSCHPKYNNMHSRYTRVYLHKGLIVYYEPDVSYSYYYQDY